MSYKLNLRSEDSYPRLTEIGQRNPIRWRILFKDGETFTDQSRWLKCKDYFNDIVCYFNTGVKFQVHGFDNNVKFNDEGLYVLVKGIEVKSTFVDNIGVINERLLKDLGVSVSVIPMESNQYVLLFPKEVFKNTYIISLLTFVIRVSNYGVPYKYWEDLWADQQPAAAHESNAVIRDAAKFACKHGFSVPKDFEQYWWYAGTQSGYHGTKDDKKDSIKHRTYDIHNTGVTTWWRGLSMAGFKG